jgi:hypothetical protein
MDAVLASRLADKQKSMNQMAISMGGAMLLGAAYPDRTHPTEAHIEADVLAGGNDPYLQMLAAGPGCNWYIPPGGAGNVRSCDGQRNAPSADPAGV